MNGREDSDARRSFWRRLERALPGAPGASLHRQHLADLERRPELRPGVKISDYTLVRLIGEGGMGQVWLAEQAALGGRRVALKLLRGERMSATQASYFEREARAGGRLNHPGIVTVYDSGSCGGHPWISMEYVEGHWSLADLVNELVETGELPTDYDRLIPGFLAAIAEAMQSAHDAGVIHRDLKPHNILIRPDNSPVVTDFGLARILDESALSRTGDVAGSYAYMSPEQVAARRAGIDHRTDIFSLGVVLYEVLSLRRPFSGETSHQVAQEILVKDPPRLRSLRPSIPRHLEQICSVAMRKDPDRRFQTMAEFARALRNIEEGNAPELPESRRRTALRSIVAPLLLMVVGGLAGVALWSQRTAPDETRAAVLEEKEARTPEVDSVVPSEEFQAPAIDEGDADSTSGGATADLEGISGSAGDERVSVVSGEKARVEEPAAGEVIEEDQQPRVASDTRPPVPQRTHPRSEWAATEPDVDVLQPMPSIRRVTLHWTGEQEPRMPRSDSEVIAQLRHLRREHVESIGWGDIGYHYLVDGRGEVWEGRSLAYQGDHAGGAENRANVGVALLLGEGAQLTPEARSGLERLLDQLRHEHGLTAEAIIGHSDLKSTACPGPQIKTFLREYRSSRRRE